MPHRVRKIGKRRYAIYDKNTGKVKGHSRSRSKAAASARIRDAKAKKKGKR